MSNPQHPAPAPGPKISVIVPIYNGVEDLPDLTACLVQQTFPKNQVEYLLVDNNSQDDTAAHLKSFAQTAKASGIQIHPLSENEIQSSYAARNRGIHQATGDILVFTDADCRPEKEWLTRIVQPFADPEVGIVIGEIAALQGNSLLERYAEYREILAQKHTYAHTFYPYGQTANLAVRRSAFQQAGLFRPYLTTGGDADLCWRIQMASDWQVVLATDAVVRHRHRATFADLQSQWRRYGRSNQYLHELHGVPLGPTVSLSKAVQQMGRWALKDLPKASWSVLRGRAPAVALLGTPLDLYCANARAKGQQQAKLPAAAREIVWLEESSAAEATP